MSKEEEILRILFKHLPDIRGGIKTIHIKDNGRPIVASIGYRLADNKRATIKVCALHLLFSSNIRKTLDGIRKQLNAALRRAGSKAKAWS